ncbi:hypothetical protein Tco_0348701 [Tanacetum coccineum]
MCDWVLSGPISLVRMDLRALLGLDLVLNKVVEMISFTNKSKPLALPRGQTPRLNSGVRVRKHVVRGEPSTRVSYYFAYNRSGRSGTLVGSTLTQTALDAFCQKDQILDIVHLELPASNQSIHDSPGGKISVYAWFFEFANFRIPLSQFLVDVLGHFRINLSQLSVIAAAKVSHFEILCRVHDYVPTVGLLCRFYLNSKNKGWMSFSKRSDTAPVCYTKPLDSLKHWNDSLFWVDASIFPLFVPWHTKKTLARDPPPTAVYRYYEFDDDIYSVFLTNDDVQDAGTHVVQDEGVNIVADEEVETTVAEDGEVNIMTDDEIQDVVADKPNKARKKRKAASGANGSSVPPKKIREDHGTSGGVGASTAGKSLVALQGLLEHKREGGEHIDSVSGPNLRTRHPAEIFVISSDSSHHSSTNVADAEVTLIVMSSVPPPLIMIAAIATTAIAGVTSALVHGLGTEPVHHSIFRDFASPSATEADVSGPSHPASAEVCWSMVDQLAPPSAEVRLRSEHNYKERKKFKRKCNRQADLLREKDAAEGARINELNGLKARNLVLEWEKSNLEGKAAALEFVVSVKNAECASWYVQTTKLTQYLSDLQLLFDELNIKAASLESQKDNLASQVSSLKATCSGRRDQVSGYELFKEQYKVVQDEQVKVLSDKVVGLDAELMGMALHLDEEFYPHFLTTIAGQRWILGRGLRLVVMKCLQSLEYLAALGGAIVRAIDKGMQDGLVKCIDHGQARRGLVDVGAYNPSAEANYVFTVNALRAMDFPLLAQLESQKDASIADIMGLLHLEGPAAETPEARQLQPSHEQLMLHIHRTEDQGSVPPILVLDYGVVDTEPQAEASSSPKIIFEQETLETSSELQTFQVRGRGCPLRSLSLYAHLPSASVTSYGPSHLGPSFPPSSTWLASLLRYTRSPGLKLVGMPISAGITTFVSYVSENGVSSLLVLIIVQYAPKTCGISSTQSLLLSSSRAFIPSPKLLFALSTKPLV